MDSMKWLPGWTSAMAADAERPPHPALHRMNAALGSRRRMVSAPRGDSNDRDVDIVYARSRANFERLERTLAPLDPTCAARLPDCRSDWTSPTSNTAQCSIITT